MRVSLPTDSEGFVRRRCPRCSREFKTRPTDEDGAVCQHVLSISLHCGNDDETSPYDRGPTCIYCGASAAALEFLTPAQLQFLKAVAEHLGLEVQQQRLGLSRRTLSQNPHPTFLAMAPIGPPPLSPREPDDLFGVSFLCCGEEARADCPTSPSLYCSRCSAVQQMGSPRRNLSLTVLDA